MRSAALIPLGMVLCLLFSCGGPPEALPEGAGEQALALVSAWLEEPEHRILTALEPAEIEGELCTVIRIEGAAPQGNYLMDTVAVSPKGERHFLASDGRWQRFQNDPYFACATAPDGSLRLESTGLYMDGPSGLHALEKINLLDAQSGLILWQTDSYLSNQFLWSPDGRFAAISYSGRAFRETKLLNTGLGDMEMPVPGPEAIRAVRPTLPAPHGNRPDTVLDAVEWVEDTVLRVAFSWWAENDIQVSGRYDYDAVHQRLTLVSVEEKPVG